ncbi:hypothetical protein LJR071_003612 [Pseudomonas sp. LjRoot71]|uniref:hypothetical protein n=1 Tax=Pseudomonas sp. LjRoot71 TaxID=3342336 RepID=UPI003ED0401C
MANHHPKLASLAKALAYRKGDLESLEKREDELLHALEEVRRKKGDAEQGIQQLSALIEAFRLDPDDVRSIRAMPRKEGSAHGAFRGTLVKILKGAGGPITTAKMLDVLRALNDSRISLPESRRDALHKITRDISTMSSYGVVIRHDSGVAGQPATWLWIGEDWESS